MNVTLDVTGYRALPRHVRDQIDAWLKEHVPDPLCRYVIRLTVGENGVVVHHLQLRPDGAGTLRPYAENGQPVQTCTLLVGVPLPPAEAFR